MTRNLVLDEKWISDARRGGWLGLTSQGIERLCDSHEQLRSDLASMTKERDEARKLLAVIAKDVPSRDWQRYLSTAGAASRPPELSRPAETLPAHVAQAHVSPESRWRPASLTWVEDRDVPTDELWFVANKRIVAKITGLSRPDGEENA